MLEDEKYKLKLRKMEINENHLVENTFTRVQNVAAWLKTLGWRGLASRPARPRDDWLHEINL
jgi:hypothetical protein